MKPTILNTIDTSSLVKLFDSHSSGRKSVGVDGVTAEQFSQNLENEVEIIHRKISKGTYNFSLYKEKLILKGANSKPRVISIPTNRDKLVHKALCRYLSAELAGSLNDESIHRKIKAIASQIKTKQYDCFIKLDIVSFYSNIKHNILFDVLKNKIGDETALSLIEMSIKQSTVPARGGCREKYRNTQGVPQGLSLSGILASLYLSKLDKKYNTADNFHYSRFVDDILIMCKASDIKNISDTIVADMENIGLEVHPFKSNNNKSQHGKISNGFQYLGYKFKGTRITVRPSSLDKIYRGINNVFLKHYKYSETVDREDKLSNLYWRLNLKITGCVYDEKQYGWLFFFSLINDKTLLFKLDAHVKRACKRFGVPFDKSEIKTFSRTYFELGKMSKGNYIPCLNSLRSATAQDIAKLLSDLEDDIEFYV